MNKRIVIPLAVFVVGVICIILARFVQVDEVFIRLLFGVGVALAILGFANTVSEWIVSRVSTPETNKTKSIEEHDERNIQIRYRAGWMTSRILLYVLCTCALICAFANVELYVTLMFAALVLLQGILGIGFTMYYDKRL